MVTTVVVPPERLGPRPAENIEQEVDQLVLSRVIVDGIGAFVRDENASELVNWGAGPGVGVLSTDAVEAAREQGLGISGIFTVLPAADLALYASLLPVSLSMPDAPEVGLAMVDFNRGNPITRYQEGWITIKARCSDGRDAWLVVSMPVSSLAMCYAGVAFGFPKYVADEMTVCGTRAEASYNGAVRFSLDFQPASCVDEDALRQQGLFAVEDALTVHPTAQGGCVLNWYQRDQVGARGMKGAVLEWIAGSVTPYLRPEDPWSALVRPGSVTPGVYQRVLETGASDGVCAKVGTAR